MDKEEEKGEDKKGKQERKTKKKERELGKWVSEDVERYKGKKDRSKGGIGEV